MSKCPKDCNKPNPFIFRKVVIPAIVDDDSINPPANGAYCNAVVVYEATGNVYLYPSDGIPTPLSSTDYNLLSNLPSINGKVLRGDVTLSDLGISQLIEEEAELRATADEILQRQIDAITVASDVVDIVGTYEELEEYDTSKLKENDIIKVLADETIGGATAYYRWVNGAWQYIGQEGPYYTKSQTDALLDQKMDITSLDDYYTKTETDTLLAAKASVSDLANKQDALVAGSNITIDPITNVISATVPSLTNYYTKSETYNKTEVDNLISGVEADIPTKTSDLQNDSGFLTSIPIASSSVLGGIKVGSGLAIAQDGTLSASGASVTIDNTLSTTSGNPVENRVITNALSGKANISDIPTVPTNVSAFYNDAGYLTSTDVANNYYNKSETYTQAQVNALIPTKTSDFVNDGSDGTSTYVEADDLATVATTGSYNDLTDKPSIPSGQVQSDWAQADASEVDYIKNKPTLAAVATSGSYNDLSDKPTIPTVNNGTLTIQQNGANVQTFTANQSGNVTANIAVPTKTSDLTNDSGYVVDDGDITCTSTEDGFAQIANPTSHNVAPLSLTHLYGNATQNGTPTPDAPIPVETVTGEQTVKITGKNLLTLDGKQIGGSTAVTFTKTSNEITLTAATGVGKYSSRTVNYTLAELGLKVGDTFSLSSDITGQYSGELGSALRVYYNNTSGSYVARLYDTNRGVSLTIPSGTTSIWLLFYIRQGTEPTVGSTATFSNIQLEKSSTATTYEPYQSASYELNLGKNLVDAENATWAVSYTNVAESDGVFHMTAEAGKTARAALPITGLVAGTTYTISCEVRAVTVADSGSDTYIRLRELSNGGTWLSNGVSINVSGSFVKKTITYTPTTITSPYLWFYLSTSTANTSSVDIYVKNIQVEAGPVATDWAEYFTPIELAKIGTYQDYIWNDNGTWKIHKAVGKVTLGGSEDITLHSTANSIIGVRLPVSNDALHNTVVLCDHFHYVPFSEYYGVTSNRTYGTITTHNSTDIDTLYASAPNSTITDAAGFKTWLGTHNIIAYYVLATPTDTAITEQGLIDQLDAILEAHLYKGISSIFLVPSAGAQGEITLCASFSRLPVATTQRLGAVMVGDGLTIAETGKLSISDETYNRFVPKDDLWKITYPLLPTTGFLIVSGDPLYYISGEDGMHYQWGFRSASDFVLHEGMRCTVDANGPDSSSDTHYNDDMGLAVHTLYGIYVRKPIYKKFPYGSWSPAPTLKYSDIPSAPNASTLLDLVYVKNSYYEGWVVTNL